MAPGACYLFGVSHPARSRCLGLFGLVGLFLLGACKPPEPPVELEEPRLRRLTEAQYVHSINDALGSEIFVPTGLEPDHRLRGFLNVGASTSSLSPRGVERFEQAAYVVAEQASRKAKTSAHP